MAAAKNNQYWKKRSKHGRDAIFKDASILLASAYEYFEWNSKNPWYKSEAIKSGDQCGTIINVPIERPLTIEGLTQFLGVNKKYFNDFERTLSEDDKDFSEVIKHIKEIIVRNQTEGAIVGSFNANIISRMLGLIDKSSVDVDLNKLSEYDLDRIIEKLTNKSSV